MGRFNSDFMQRFIRMASDGWMLGWHERNGGNLSYRLTEEDIDDISSAIRASEPGPWVKIDILSDQGATNIAGDLFLITGGGKYFRNFESDPSECLGIIEIDDVCSRYRTRWGFESGADPTSEIASHLLNQSVIKERTSGRYKVAYHCHPPNTIALSFVLPRDSYIFTRQLWAMISECAMVFPDGVEVLEWMVPGSADLGIKTAEAIKKADVVIWPFHGVFCVGEDFDGTFGLMHTVEKASEIAVKVKSMLPADSNTALPGITDDDLSELARAYGLKLRY